MVERGLVKKVLKGESPSWPRRARSHKVAAILDFLGPSNWNTHTTHCGGRSGWCVSQPGKSRVEAAGTVRAILKINGGEHGNKSQHYKGGLSLQRMRRRSKPWKHSCAFFLARFELEGLLNNSRSFPTDEQFRQKETEDTG